MSKLEYTKRYSVLAIGLMIAGFGVSIAKLAELGVSPISSTANVMSVYLPQLSLGNWIILWNCLLIVGQMALLRKNFRPIEFLQLPISLLFGYCTDLGMFCFGFLKPQNYPSQLLLMAVGIVVLALGLSLSVLANVVMNSGEAFVKAIAVTTHKEFGHIKIGFDLSCVLLAVVLSLLFFDGRVVGVREGTILSALCTGLLVKCFSDRSKGWLLPFFG